MDELKTGEFVDRYGRTCEALCIGAMRSTDVIRPGDPEAMDAGKAFLALAEEAQNPWVEISDSNDSGTNFRIRKDGTCPQWYASGKWMSCEDTFFSTGYRACMKAYGLGGEE